MKGVLPARISWPDVYEDEVRGRFESLLVQVVPDVVGEEIRVIVRHDEASGDLLAEQVGAGLVIVDYLVSGLEGLEGLGRIQR